MLFQAGPHPDPRPGVDASRVLMADQLQTVPDQIPLYDKIRQIPHIADGIRCYCGCAELPDYRSLLTCFEEGGMAMYCEICQGQGSMTYRLHERGMSLDQIRARTDALYGSGRGSRDAPQSALSAAQINDQSFYCRPK